MVSFPVVEAALVLIQQPLHVLIVVVTMLHLSVYFLSRSAIRYCLTLRVILLLLNFLLQIPWKQSCIKVNRNILELVLVVSIIGKHTIVLRVVRARRHTDFGVICVPLTRGRNHRSF